MHRIALVLPPGFQVIALAALSAFEYANQAGELLTYEVKVLAARKGPLPSSIPGVVMQCGPLEEEDYDTVIFAGGVDMTPASPAVIHFAQWAARKARRVASICTGAYVLAQAGLLDGRRVTTHWAMVPALQRHFPKLKIDSDRIFVVDGQIWTSAGASAGVDLALGMVENDLGEEVARQVAKKLVLYHRRGGGQSQHSALLEMDPKTDRIRAALDFAKRNLAKDIGVEDLAEAAHLSPRQFSRAFRSETGSTPARAIENLRVEAARILMEQSVHPVEVVASKTGFGDRERMRRAFLRTVGQSPMALRRTSKSIVRSGGI